MLCAKASYQLTVSRYSHQEYSHALTILEGFGYVIIAEATRSEGPRDFAVLLSNGFAGCEERAERVETDEEVLFGHGFDG